MGENVRSLSRLYLIPQWGKWPLSEMSGSPGAVRDWHIQVTKDAGADNGKPLRPDYARLL